MNIKNVLFLPFCQRAHDLRVVNDECWVDTCDLKEISNQLSKPKVYIFNK